MADEELIKEFCRGNAEAMSELFVRYRMPVYGWFKQVLPDEADDLYQELWLKVIKKASSFSGSGFRVWLWKIARNMVIDVYRKKKPLLVLDEAEGDDALAREDQNRILQDSFSFLDELDKSEYRAILHECVQKLPQGQKEVVLLRIISELSFAEISNILSLRLNTVLGRMHLAVKHLKASFKERLGENG